MVNSIKRVENNEKLVSLTFDDGPSPQYTPRVLNILEKYNATGTFFMTGERAEKHRDVVRDVARRGHDIGNHTFDHPHPSLGTLPVWEREQQLRRTAEALEPWGGDLFRPPYGRETFSQKCHVWIHGLTSVLWDVEVQDWRAHHPHDMTAELVERIQSGSIVLLHDAVYQGQGEVEEDRTGMLRALSDTLAEIGGNYNFVGVKELIHSVDR